MFQKSRVLAGIEAIYYRQSQEVSKSYVANSRDAPCIYLADARAGAHIAVRIVMHTTSAHTYVSFGCDRLIGRGKRGGSDEVKGERPLIVGYVQLSDTAGASAQHRPLNC